jgi:hypothetical protein
MKNKNKLQEALGDDGTTVFTPKNELASTVDALKGKKVDIQVTPDSLFNEEEDIDAVIEPQDQATIKYLSNVVDDKTGKISQPFAIGDKNYRMVRGVKPNKEVVLSVMCLEDRNIYEVEHFEKEVALPMKEMLEKENTQHVAKDDIDEIKEMGLSEYKHYVVNEKSNSFKKFKTIQELVKNGLSEEEKYMNLREFKKFYEGKVFGKKQITDEGSEQ